MNIQQDRLTESTKLFVIVICIAATVFEVNSVQNSLMIQLYS